MAHTIILTKQGVVWIVKVTIEEQVTETAFTTFTEAKAFIEKRSAELAITDQA